MFYAVILIAVFALMFPKLFGFVKSIFFFFWNILGTVVMFFVNLFSKFDFGFLGDGLDWMLRMLDKLLTPVRFIMPDSIISPIILLVLLGILYMLLSNIGANLNKDSFDFGLKMNYAWCSAALNLGLIAAASGHPHRWLSGVLDTYFTDYPMTLSNFTEWSSMARGMLILALIGGIIVSIIYACFSGPRGFARTWVGISFCGVLGYVYMRARLFIFYWLVDSMGFIGSLLNIPVGFIECIIFIQFFAGIVVFLLPSGAIASMNEAREAKERRERRSPAKASASKDDFETDFDFGDSFPSYVTDDDGKTYRVEHDGDFIYICMPNGSRISTKWEYVKGGSYFNLEGKRFYPH